MRYAIALLFLTLITSDSLAFGGMIARHRARVNARVMARHTPITVVGTQTTTTTTTTTGCLSGKCPVVPPAKTPTVAPPVKK